MKAGTEFCRNVFLNYQRTGVTHYGGVTVQTNLVPRKSHVKSQSFYHYTYNRNL